MPVERPKSRWYSGSSGVSVLVPIVRTSRPIRAFHEPEVTVPTIRCRHRARPRACEGLAAPGRRGGRERPARPGGQRQRAARPGGPGPRDRRGRLPPRRALRGRGLVRPARQAGAPRARAPRTRSTGCRPGGRAHHRARPDGAAPDRPDRPDRPGPVRRRRPGPRRARPPALGARGDRGDHGGAGQLDRRALPQPGLGRAGAPGPRPRGRARAAVGARSPTSAGSTSRTPPRRGARAAEELEASARRLDARRLAALRFVGPGTDLTVGLLPGLALDRRRRPPPRRPAAPAEHPHRGGVHDARPRAHRGPRHLDAPARRGRHGGARACGCASRAAAR